MVIKHLVCRVIVIHVVKVLFVDFQMAAGNPTAGSDQGALT